MIVFYNFSDGECFIASLNLINSMTNPELNNEDDDGNFSMNILINH